MVAMLKRMARVMCGYQVVDQRWSRGCLASELAVILRRSITVLTVLAHMQLPYTAIACDWHVQTFDGRPASPDPWSPADWDIILYLGPLIPRTRITPWREHMASSAHRLQTVIALMTLAMLSFSAMTMS